MHGMHGFHHLRNRMRNTQGLGAFSSRSARIRALDYLMYFVGIVSPLALLPQILQIYNTQSSEGVSLLTWVLLTFAGILWTMYAVVHKDKHLLFASACMMIFHVALLVGLVLY